MYLLGIVFFVQQNFNITYLSEWYKIASSPYYL